MLKIAGPDSTSLGIQDAVAYKNKISCCNKGLTFFRNNGKYIHKVGKVITDCLNIFSHIPGIYKFKFVVILTQYSIFKGCCIHPERQCDNPFCSKLPWCNSNMTKQHPFATKQGEEVGARGGYHHTLGNLVFKPNRNPGVN